MLVDLTASINDELEQRKDSGLFRKRELIESSQGPLVDIDGQQYLNFSNNDYLGFANNDDLKECMIEAVRSYGIGAGSSQLLVGHSSVHKDLETRLSHFLKRDAALVFSTGYQANLSIASVLIDTDTIVLQDKLNHASLIDAAVLSKGKLIRYKHNDTEHLKALLQKYKQHKLVLMTDGVFSMDGDYAPLIEIADLCKQYNAVLIVDDAHGIGVLGRTGAGLLEELGLTQEQVPLLVGTFGKSFGASGAFIAGHDLLIEMFVQKARTYIYTTALMPAVAATMCLAIEKNIDGDELRKRLRRLIDHYKQSIINNGLSPSSSKSHIQPFVIGEANRTMDVSRLLKNKKILVPAIRPPTVPKGTSRLRISLTASHTIDQVEKLVQSIKAVL